MTADLDAPEWKQPLFGLFAAAVLIGLSGPFAAGWALSFVALEDPTDPIPPSLGIQGALLLTVPALIWWIFVGWCYLDCPVPTHVKNVWAALPRLIRFLVILAAAIILGPFALAIAYIGFLPLLLSLWPWVLIVPLWGIWELAGNPHNGSPTRT